MMKLTDKNIFILLIKGTLKTIFVTLLTYYGIWYLVNRENFFETRLFLSNLLFVTLFGLISTGSNIFFFRRGYFEHFSRKKIYLQALGILVTNLVVVIVLDWVFYYYWDALHMDRYWKDCYACAVTASLASFVSIAGLYGRILVEQNDKNLRMELSLLKRQLDPHFMFNSLNALAELSQTDPPAVEAFAIKLSHVYRYLLRYLEEDHVTIGSAMQFTREYCELLEMRHPGSFRVHFAEHLEEDSGFIASLGVQLLTENAIKHNRHTPENPLDIFYERKGDYLVVRNTLRPLAHPLTPTDGGMGLKNLNKRSLLLCGRAIVVKQDKHTFEVQLPVIFRKP